MSPVSMEILIAVLGVVISVCTSMFVAGSRWGQIQGDVRNMSDRLAKIEGMFTLRLRDGDEHDGHRS